MTRPVRGVGLGLRWEWMDELVERVHEGNAPRGIDFLEVTPENTMRRGGGVSAALTCLAAAYPILTHGLTLSLGGTDPLDEPYLDDLALSLQVLQPPWHSDHLSVTQIDGRCVHELLPVAAKRSNVARVADRIRRSQERLGRPLAIENVSYYCPPGHAEMSEVDFVAHVCEAADCGLLLDVNNVYVNSLNFGFRAEAWLEQAPLHRVVEVHVAGHEWFALDASGLGEKRPAHAPDALPVDTHGATTPEAVLVLLEQVLRKTGPVPVVLERDQNIPALDVLLAEAEHIRVRYERAVGG